VIGVDRRNIDIVKRASIALVLLKSVRALLRHTSLKMGRARPIVA
jgi:hypothetical protein